MEPNVTHSFDTSATTRRQQTSQLYKPLAAILNDSSGGAALSMFEYFIQYMEEQDALHLLQFWFAVESFKIAATSPKHTTDQNRCLNSSKLPQVDDKPPACDVVDMETNVAIQDHRTVIRLCETAVTDTEIRSGERLDCEYKMDSMTLLYPTFSSNSVTGSDLSGGTIHCNVEGSIRESPPGQFIAKSDALKDQNKQQSTVNDMVSRNGTHVHERLLKQLSLGSRSVDALSIYTTYIALNALCPVNIPDELRQQIEVNICPEDGKVNRSCFNSAQDFVYQCLEERYYPGFLSSHQLCKYQFEYISCGNLCLLDFLLGDNALFYFMEFMEQENSTPLVQFWLTANSFRRQLSDTLHVLNIERDTEDAMAIYERYFSLQASSPLHLGDTTRMDIENKICDEAGPRVDSYDTAQRQAYDRMNELYFPGFLKSSVYLRFLNELVITLNRPATMRQSATSSPPHSNATSQQLGDNQPDFPENLDDPDSLWMRPYTVLRLGYVDKFGQYVSEIDPIPSSKPVRQRGDTSGKKFSWLRKSQDEEELAMKIAKTVVREVLDVQCTEPASKTAPTES